MKAKVPRISDSELQIMQLLWEDSPLSAAEISKALPDSLGWSPTTVKTMLSRLVGKGALATDPDGRRFLYRPLVERQQLAAGQAGGLIDRLFGGRVSPLVAQLAEQREIDPEDLAELERLVRSLKQ